MKNKLGLVKRLGILAVLLLCLGFVAFTPNTQPVLAIPCCSSCPVQDLEEIPLYCQDLCQVRNGPCYDACVANASYCLTHCSHSPSCDP
jgi:hypothetical protein